LGRQGDILVQGLRSEKIVFTPLARSFAPNAPPIDPGNNVIGSKGHSHRMPPPDRRFQFTVRELLIAVAGIAVVLAIHVSTAGIVTRLVVPRTYAGSVALFLIALSCYFSWKRSDCHNAFWILVIAWYFGLTDILCRLGARILPGGTVDWSFVLDQ
jgi:hypothetical protein